MIGAGFSVGLGYPLTSGLLIGTWDKLNDENRDNLRKVIQFHYPNFDPRRRTSFPNIEQLLTKIRVNHDMFSMSRSVKGRFMKEDLLKVQKTLLYSIAEWFHAIHVSTPKPIWLEILVKRLKNENAVIISFNWDLVLDDMLFRTMNAEAYGLTETSNSPILLKPHGSLNWYEADTIGNVKAEKHIRIFGKTEKTKDCVDAFLLARGIHSKIGHQYMPLIVAPSYLKDFNRPIFKPIWQQCTNAISTASHIYFLGYSLPADDMQAQFILRCGFYNQLNGMPKKGGRHKPTGGSEVTIVNPDQEAARRIEAVAGNSVHCRWVTKGIEKWI